MTVDQERGSGAKARMHGQGVAGVELDQDEALPAGAVALGVGPNVMKDCLLEFENLFHMHADDQGLGSGRMRVGESDVFEIVRARGKDGGTLVDFGRIKEVENREVLHMEYLVHAFEAESAFAIKEIGDMSLLESSLLGKVESGQFPGFNAVPKNFTKIFLQNFELHGRSIAPELGEAVSLERIREPGVRLYLHKKTLGMRAVIRDRLVR